MGLLSRVTFVRRARRSSCLLTGAFCHPLVQRTFCLAENPGVGGRCHSFWGSCQLSGSLRKMPRRALEALGSQVVAKQSREIFSKGMSTFTAW